MVQIRCSSKHLSEKNYIFDVLFTEILGVPYEVVESSIGQYEIILPNGNFMIIEDHFFEKHDNRVSRGNLQSLSREEGSN